VPRLHRHLVGEGPRAVAVAVLHDARSDSGARSPRGVGRARPDRPGGNSTSHFRWHRSRRTSEKSSHSSHVLLPPEIRRPRPIRQITPSPTPQAQRVTASSVPLSPASPTPSSKHRYALTFSSCPKPIAQPYAQQQSNDSATEVGAEGLRLHFGYRERGVATLSSV
jgi:hypothetical protein